MRRSDQDGVFLTTVPNYLPPACASCPTLNNLGVASIHAHIFRHYFLSFLVSPCHIRSTTYITYVNDQHTRNTYRPHNKKFVVFLISSNFLFISLSHKMANSDRTAVALLLEVEVRPYNVRLEAHTLRGFVGTWNDLYLLSYRGRNPRCLDGDIVTRRDSPNNLAQTQLLSSVA